MLRLVVIIFIKCLISNFFENKVVKNELNDFEVVCFCFVIYKLEIFLGSILFLILRCCI